MDGSGVSESVDFHWLLGPILMITFAFLGNTLFLTILVSMLTNTFANVVANATAEIHFRKAVLTLEGVKSDAIFAYQPPFNIIALFILVPMKFLVSPRWFHKIHVAFVRAINLPVLLFIAVLERRLLWSEYAGEVKQQQKRKHRGKGRFWEKWRITSHGDIQTVFDIPPPDSIEEDIAVDDELTHHMIRRQFLRHQSSSQPRDSQISRDTSKEPPTKTPSRRDSLAPFGVPPEQVRNLLSETSQAEDLSARLAELERTSSRIEEILERMCSGAADGDSLCEEERKASEVDGL